MAELSAHWRVIGATVERNVLVTVPRGITIGDNYSLVPANCTIRDNLVVAATTGAAITQRVAPSNTVITNNQYYATTTAAGMTQDAATVWRKPGYGPRLTYLALTDVGPSGDTGDTDGTGVALGGTLTVPADVLNIGPETGRNHYQLQYAVDGSTGNNWTKAEFSAVAAGFATDPYFKVVSNVIDGFTVPAVQFRVRADSATTTGSSFPRSEMRETKADGSDMAFDAMAGDHSLHFRARVTNLPSADPEVIVAQLHNGVTGDRISVRTQSVSGSTKLLVRINGSQVDPRLDESYTVGDEFEVLIKVLNGGLVSVYYQGSTTPIVTGQLVSTGSPSWYWKFGAYAQFNATTASATDYVTVEHRDVATYHSAPKVDAGVDAQAVKGIVFTRTADDSAVTAVLSRRWTIVGRPAAPPTDPPPVDPPPSSDQTLAAVRFNWGTPLASSDEFNYVGPPDPNKWDLPGSDWAGHDGNGRRRPERQTVDGSKLVMTGLANGDSGWMAHRVNREYGRYEARVRAYNTGSSNGNLYSPVLLIWPTSDSRKSDGEYDYYEPGSPGSQTLTAFCHFPGDGDQQREFTKSGVDLSQFHNIGFEWTSNGLTGYLDGQQWFTTSGGSGSGRRNIQAMGSGFATCQLDNFDGTNQTPATFEMEFFRVYDL